MHIEKLSIHGVRGSGLGVDLDFAAARDDLAGWTVVAGRNGSGKTTLLRALACAILGRDNTVALMDNSFDDWLDAPVPEATVHVSLRSHEGDSFSRAERRFGADPMDRTGRGAVRPAQMPVSLRWKRYDDAVGLDADGLTSTLVAQNGPWARKRQGWCLVAYGAMRRLSGHTADAQRWMNHDHPLAGVVTLFREDASLAEAVVRLREDDGRAHLETVLALLNDGLLPDPALRCVGVSSKGLVVERSGRSMVLEALSEGYRVIGALVLDLLLQIARQHGGALDVVRDGAGVRVLNAAVVLIDEVDTHLHVTWQRQIGRWLTAHFPRVQFVVTSHSPFVCQAADRGGLVLLPGPGATEPARIADDALWRRVTGGSVDDALLSDVFGLDHTWSDDVADDRVRLAELESKVVRGVADAATHAEVGAIRSRLYLTGSSEVEQQMRTLLESLQRKAS